MFWGIFFSKGWLCRQNSKNVYLNKCLNINCNASKAESVPPTSVGVDDDVMSGRLKNPVSVGAVIQRDVALRVVRGLLAIMTEYNSTHYDTFLVMCKVNSLFMYETELAWAKHILIAEF